MSTNPGEFRQCRKCARETYDPIENCRKCGGELLGEDRIRSVGSLNYALGTLLAVIMGLTFAGILFLAVFIMEPPKLNSVMKIDPVSRDLSIFAGLVFTGGIFSAGWYIRRAGRRQQETARLEARDMTIFMAIIGASLAAVTILMALAGE
ncbi:MAG: hypothetical protein QUS14_06005 [Pyrinomonadaceae bacterium]|nr:hypothetical protein [Pyrinomonadaceae bacterium]